jgi:hypothetical protein
VEARGLWGFFFLEFLEREREKIKVVFGHENNLGVLLSDL